MVDPEVFNCQSVLISCHIGTNNEAYNIVPRAIKKLLTEGAPTISAITISRPDLPTPEYTYTINECFEKSR